MECRPLPPRPIATFDLTWRCPLRCRHCYFYASPLSSADLSPSVFLERLEKLRREYSIRSAFWVGGEPLLRKNLLFQALVLFERNGISTSGMVPIPPDLDAGLLVSIDGPRKYHDDLRGPGSFDKVMKNLAPLASGSFFLSTTINSTNLTSIEEWPRLVERTRAGGILVGFFTGPLHHPFQLSSQQRNQVIDRLLILREQEPATILNPPDALEWFRPARSHQRASSCIYRDSAISFDPQLSPKWPCTFDTMANCQVCGCALVALQEARKEGCTDSWKVMKTLFPHHRKN